MRTILVILVLVAIAFGLGWVYFRDTGETVELIIDKEEVREDKEEMIEKSREWMSDDDALEEAPSDPAREPAVETGPSAGTISQQAVCKSVNLASTATGSRG